MYSVVLMAALTTGSAAPDWGVKSYIAPGCYGCWGYGCYSACYGPGCHHWNNGYYGNGCVGWGGSSWGCNGCGGCGSGYYGCTCSGCVGFYGSPYSPMYGGGPITPMPPADAPPMKKEDDKGDKKDENKDGNKDDKGSSLGNRARLLVEVPAGATLFIDDQPMRNTATLRTFRTPELDRSQTYFYLVRVELNQGGSTHREQRRVLLRAGEEVRQSFTEATVLAASRQNAAARR